MTSYYPSQGVPVAYSAGYGQPGYAGYGPSAGGVMYVPSSSYGHGRRHRRHHNYYSPQAVPAVGPVVMVGCMHFSLIFKNSPSPDTKPWSLLWLL